MEDVPNGSTYNDEKSELRKRLSALRGSVADKQALSAEICAAAAKLVVWSVMVYVSIGTEVDTRPLLRELISRADVKLYAPYTTADGTIVPRRVVDISAADRRGNMAESAYGDDGRGAKKLDFCITPLLGFNEKGYRIGYGKGCYDRFFENVSVYKIGLAYECQLARFAPECHDVPLDCCVTEKKVIYF